MVERLGDELRRLKLAGRSRAVAERERESEDQLHPLERSRGEYGSGATGGVHRNQQQGSKSGPGENSSSSSSEEQWKRAESQRISTQIESQHKADQLNRLRQEPSPSLPLLPDLP